MRTMSGGPCLHYDCSNRNSFGYCKTTACINEHYQREQWGLLSTTNKSESVVIKQPTNADRLRAMSDEELAEFYCNDVDACPPGSDMKCIDELYAHGEGPYTSDEQCRKFWLDWLRQEAEA